MTLELSIAQPPRHLISTSTTDQIVKVDDGRDRKSNNNSNQARSASQLELLVASNPSLHAKINGDILAPKTNTVVNFSRRNQRTRPGPEPTYPQILRTYASCVTAKAIAVLYGVEGLLFCSLLSRVESQATRFDSLIEVTAHFAFGVGERAV